jgi:hypothetical protein
MLPHLRLRLTHALRSSRLVTLHRYRNAFVLLLLPFLLGTALYLQSDTLPSPYKIFRYYSSAPTELFSEPNWDSIYGSPTHLWSYIPEVDEFGDGGIDAWRWVNKHRRGGYRRPSWGGLTQQGAKGHIRTNLKRDKHYLLTFPWAGFTNQFIETCNREYHP